MRQDLRKNEKPEKCSKQHYFGFMCNVRPNYTIDHLLSDHEVPVYNSIYLLPSVQEFACRISHLLNMDLLLLQWRIFPL